MTHGPKPKKAIDEAWRIASGRGPVLNISMMRTFPGDLLLIAGSQIVFIRVRRSRTHACEPRDIERQFKEAILDLRTVPQNPAICREIHVLAPWGVWQYFRVDNDRVTEIHNNGSSLPQEGEVPAPGMPVPFRSTVPGT
jgi:hypothetical protein